MGGTRKAATVAVFTALIVATNFGLAEFPNVKLDAAVILLTTVAFGGPIGASVAVLSELIWSQVSPWGPSGAYLLPFLLSGEMLYVVAGLTTRRVTGGGFGGPQDGLVLGGILAIFTFVWDVWTNLGTAILGTNMTPGAILLVEFNPGALAFNVVHEVSNLVLGMAFVPAALDLLPRLSKGLVERRAE